jgi:hypothetical protein
MVRKVEFRIDNKGEIRTEFTGFLGQECYEEGERLRGLLIALGLELGPGQVRPKSETEMALEAGLDVKSGDAAAAEGATADGEGVARARPRRKNP